MKIFLISLAFFCIANLQSQNCLGTWNGVLVVPGAELDIVFHIIDDGEKLLATMDSPKQGGFDIPTSACSCSDGTLTITIENMNIKYLGKFSVDGDKISGTFNQGPMTFPLELKKGDVTPKPRLQDPVHFNYRVEDIKFVNENGGHTLAGTLTIPFNDFNTVVVLVSGSGPQNRNAELTPFNHRPFLVLSDYLTRNGIAVLRYDDRGIEESDGDFASATSRDFADDASAAVDYLVSLDEFKNKLIGIAGHSEGGLIAPLVANSNKMVDFIVLLGAPGIPIPELMQIQATKISMAEGVSPRTIEANTSLTKRAYNYITQNTNVDKPTMQVELSKIMTEELINFPQETLNQIGDQNKFIQSQVAMLSSDWMQYFLRSNPGQNLENTKCPVLAITGELDLQVTPNENLAGIKSALEKGKNPNYMIKQMPSQNHLFQTCKTGAPSEYMNIEETFNEETMSLIADWIKSVEK